VDAITLTRTIGGVANDVRVEAASEKLRWRGGLPGASIYDRAAHVLRSLQSSGASAIDLLPLALPACWLVNARASSRAMQRWLAPPASEAWADLLDLLGFELSLEDWLTAEPELRAAAAANVEKLASGYEGSSLVAVTKVLALLRPQLVPLMDDAAIWFSLDLVPEPKTADAPIAAPTAFVPMMDWFAREVARNEDALVAIASRHDMAILDAPQTLDRLLWVVSWGR
jgi:hypothetical protein